LAISLCSSKKLLLSTGWMKLYFARLFKSRTKKMF
jgi:hypothetical protein